MADADNCRFLKNVFLKKKKKNDKKNLLLKFGSHKAHFGLKIGLILRSKWALWDPNFKNKCFCHFWFFFQKKFFLRNRHPPKYSHFFLKSLRQKLAILQPLEYNHPSSLNIRDTPNFKITLKNTITCVKKNVSYIY